MPSPYFYIASKTSHAWSDHKPLSVGDKVVTGGVNPFFNYFLGDHLFKVQVDSNDGEINLSILNYLNSLVTGQTNTTQPVPSIAQLGHHVGLHFCKYTRELIWENIRISEFKEKPSRQKCLWLANGEDNLKYWMNNLNANTSTHNVFQVDIVDGILHEASDEFLMRDADPYPIAQEKARKYWRGEITNPLGKEILFEGTINLIGLVG